jgi:hypothetical protein
MAENAALEVGIVESGKRKRYGLDIKLFALQGEAKL